ncbi:collagen alpha-1(I) chain-like [Cervus elaphus]|uniref:collagen alpha-1(I) chain-like n=1 Tax=Cervus elaphus TaxID=9860 RepID=UPI001CC2F761|nr:collagen alpha-1(I) chain-like [Cervus elaphus]
MGCRVKPAAAWQGSGARGARCPRGAAGEPERPPPPGWLARLRCDQPGGRAGRLQGGPAVPRSERVGGRPIAIATRPGVAGPGPAAVRAPTAGTPARCGAGVPGSRGLARPGAAREVRADPMQKLAPGRVGRSGGVSGRLGQACGASGSPLSFSGRRSAGLAGDYPGVSREARRESPKSAQGAGRFPAEVLAGEESPLTFAFLPVGPGARLPPRATAPALRRERGARALPHLEGPPGLPRAPGWPLCRPAGVPDSWARGSAPGLEGTHKDKLKREREISKY